MEQGGTTVINQPDGLYFLTHPGSEGVFSGYGLAPEAGRSDRLSGLLMVDRPKPVDPAWLDEIEGLFGPYTLTPMTATGERGIACQMRIERKSLPFVQQIDHPLAKPMTRALHPLLENPPNPIFKLRWDHRQGLWASQPWIGLPQALQEVFERTGPGCLAVERGDVVAFVTHAPDHDIESFRGAPVLYQWELIQMPSAPLVRFRAVIVDDPLAPFILEHFLNVEDPEQVRCLERLADQEEIIFDFFGQEYEYAYSKQLPHSPEMRRDLRMITDRAIGQWEGLPESTRDYDRAKALYQRWFPV